MLGHMVLLSAPKTAQTHLVKTKQNKTFAVQARPKGRSHSHLTLARHYTPLCPKQMRCGKGARQLGKLILKNEEKWMRGWALWGLQMCIRVLSAEGKLEKGLCCYGEGQRHDHLSLSPALFSGSDGPRHLQQIDRWAGIQKASYRNKLQGFVFIQIF